MDNATQLVFRIYLWFCVVALIVYLPRISFYLVAFRKQERLRSSEKHRIAVIVPARDEQAVISHCLDSLASQTYDPRCFDIHLVIADEADPTAQIASAYERCSVTVIGGQTCKGEALDGVLKKILAQTPDAYDAFLFLDADNLAAPDLLEEMNNALSSGRQIVCGKKLIKNWQSGRRASRSFIANCTALTYTQIDELGNRARNHLGLSVTMVGTGMLVRADVIRENGGWPYRSLTEDYEMTADAIVKGWTSLYYSHAQVFTEEACDARSAFKRKMRWIKGYTQCQRRYFSVILKKVLAGHIRWRNLGFLFATFPPYAFFAVSAVAMIFGFVALASSLLFGTVGLAPALRMVLLPFLFIYGVLFVYTLVPLFVDRAQVKISWPEKIAVLFGNPLYTLGYFRIFLTAFVTSDDHFAWESTARFSTGIFADFTDKLEESV
ncbi:MAG: glycosyltransferase [Actinomycetia bacterium]|nr:glycosyltransferase [Actinomycetes bacterium]